MNKHEHKKPYPVASLVLGILSLSFGFFFPFIGISMGLVGVVLVLDDSKNTPFDRHTRHLARYMCAIGVVLSGVALFIGYYS